MYKKGISIIRGSAVSGNTKLRNEIWYYSVGRWESWEIVEECGIKQGEV